jgi:hypothetical protein
MAEGADMLAESQDVEVQSEIVRSLGEADLEFAMAIAAISGQIAVVGDIATLRDMPVLAIFLENKGAALHELAVESIVKFGATRAVAKSMARTAGRVGALGADEMVEGMARLEVAAKGAAVSEAMAEAGAMKVVQGAVEIEASRDLREMAGAIAAQGVADVAAGSEKVGGAVVLDATAGALAEKAQ